MLEPPRSMTSLSPTSLSGSTQMGPFGTTAEHLR
ncbi:hypothetical protein OESDEN_14917, partial [Oesophagostomum dentatum]